MNKLRQRRNATFIVMEGIAAAIVLNLFNPYVQMFAKRLGARDIHFALMNSLPQLVAILVLIPCSIFIDKIKDKKLVTCFLIVINSAFYLIIAFLPFLPNNYRLIVYIIFIALMNWPGSLYTTTWQTFFSYTFGSQDASGIYSSRSKYGAFFGLVTALLTGYVLSAFPKSEGGRIVVYQIFYFLCFAFSIIQVLLLSRIKQVEVEDTNNNDTSLKSFTKEDFKEIFSNKPFIIYCLCIFAFYFSWQMGWPIFFIYSVDIIKANEFQLGLISVASGLSSFVSYPLWNKLMKKKGTNIVIIFGAFGLAINPFFYMQTLHLYTVILINLVLGAFAAGYTLTVFCNLLNVLPERKRTVYISVFNTFITVSGFISPLVGVWLSRITGISLAFMVIGILRMTAVGFFIARWYFESKSIKNIKQDK